MRFEVFISYSHKDKELRQLLDTHLASLKHQGKITAWHDREIEAGQDWENEIRIHLEAAHLILLLISPDFIASEYCYDLEMHRAMERHEEKTAIIVPIILRPAYWKNTPFSKLQALPEEGQAITTWENQDEAFFNVIEGVDQAIQKLENILIQRASIKQASKSCIQQNSPQISCSKYIWFEEKYGDRKISIPASTSVPKNLINTSRHCIDECIFIAGGFRKGMFHAWSEHEISLQFKLDFLCLDARFFNIQQDMNKKLSHENHVSAPRFNLKKVITEPTDHFRHGGLTVYANLTDWALIHGIQEIMRDNKNGKLLDELKNDFWNSVSSLIGEGKALNFPHHLSTHCLVISQDNKVILNRRRGVSNQQGRISASFEEQMQFSCIYPATINRKARYFDGDESPFDAIQRGAREELNIELDKSNIKIMSLCMESSSIAANFIGFARCDLTAREIYYLWEDAQDRDENTMITPDLSPDWNIESMTTLLESETVFADHPIYKGCWHASSKARIILGLIHEFGLHSVQENLDLF